MQEESKLAEAESSSINHTKRLLADLRNRLDPLVQVVTDTGFRIADGTHAPGRLMVEPNFHGWHDFGWTSPPPLPKAEQLLRGGAMVIGDHGFRSGRVLIFLCGVSVFLSANGDCHLNGGFAYGTVNADATKHNYFIDFGSVSGKPDTIEFKATASSLIDSVIREFPTCIERFVEFLDRMRNMAPPRN